MKYPTLSAVPALALLLAACTVGPQYQGPQTDAGARFQAGLPPEQGNSGRASDLGQWWRQFDDPLVPELVDTAQRNSPSIEAALARIVQARAAADAAGAQRWPTVNGNLSAERSSSVVAVDTSLVDTTTNRSLDARWEIDLFGARRKGAEAAAARLAARGADWHAARVSLAAEVAATLVDYRACAATATLQERDAGSRAQTADLSRLKIHAGLTAASDGALIDASAAQAHDRAVAQRADCDLTVKALVALTDLPEPALRARLDSSTLLPRPQAIRVDTVPLQALAQRPDIAALERELAAAGADINVAQANRYPSISVAASIGMTGVRIGGASSTTRAWSILPGIDIPLFDAGLRRADADAARGRYAESYANYRQGVRDALREIEQALVRLDAAARRETYATAAARDFERYFLANDDSFKAGTGSMFELEEARRSSLLAQQSLIALQHDRIIAWIALYKALGGGWHAGAAPLADAAVAGVGSPI